MGLARGDGCGHAVVLRGDLEHHLAAVAHPDQAHPVRVEARVLLELLDDGDLVLVLERRSIEHVSALLRCPG